MSTPTALLGADLGRVANRVKGLLMLVVIIDHNDWFRPLAPALFGPLTFHVLGFFLLAISFTTTPFSGAFMAARAARYLLPFWWALALSSLAFGFVFQAAIPESVRLENFLLAALIGSARLVKTASGLFMLWFLPCLFGLTCLVALHDAWRGPKARSVAWASALVAHLALPYLTGLWLPWVPFGLLIAAHVFLLGLVWRQLLRLRFPHHVGPLALAVFLVSYGLLVVNRVHIEIGTFEISALQNPPIVLLHWVTLYSAMLSLVWVAGYVDAAGWVEKMGKNALLIYLIHPVFYLLLTQIWVSPALAQTSRLLLLVHACTTSAVVASLAYGTAHMVARSAWLSAWIRPQTWRTWPPVMYFQKLENA